MDYSVPAAEFAKHEVTLTAGVQDTVSFEGRRSFVEVCNLSDGSEVVYFTTNGVNAEVRGGASYFVLPGGQVQVGDERQTNSTLVKLISDQAAVYSVTAAPLQSP